MIAVSVPVPMRRMARALLATVCAVTMLSLPLAVRAQSAPAESRSYWVVLSGLSGEPDIASKYADWTGRIAKAATERFNATAVFRLGENAGDGVILSTRANVDSVMKEIAQRVTTNDNVFIVIVGHGSAAEGPARIALPGPDLTAPDLAKMLETVHAHVVVINTSSASGAWVEPLAAPNRIVVTATRSGVEQNETTFGQYFADAMTNADADTDKDERVSVLEAYTYARGMVERAYAADKKLLTEHAQIDGNGDGKAVAAAAVDSPDGSIASLTFLGSSARATVTGPQSPELRALYAEKARLEQQLAQLRAKKADLPQADYQKQLEALLLEIAKNGQSIRKLEGGS